MTGSRGRGVASTLALLLVTSVGAAAQEPSARDRIEALSYEPLRFDQPEPDRHELRGVPVLLLEDHSLPLVTVLVGFEGGYGLFPREDYAAATALPALLRYGGTTDMAPAEVDTEIERYAIQLSFGSGGGAVSSTMNTLTEHLEVSLDLWGRMLAEPGFDAGEIEVWRGRQLESIRRRPDDPATVAFSEFNRLLYGDHPIGWEMDEQDLTEDALAPDRLQRLHRRILCRDNLLVGVTGDVSWTALRRHMDAFLARIPACDEPLPEPPRPDVRHEPGVFVIDRDIEQAVIVMAHPTDLPLADRPDYFAATIGNTILGSGGFSSRIMDRVRTEHGYAYTASSLWTTPRRYEGLLGAVTRTAPENVGGAVAVILDTMRELAREPPREEEVSNAVERIVNGFVFNFESPAQIVSRTMFYMAQDLPGDWLERYLRGVQAVDREAVGRVFAEHLRPSEMTILLVGDAERIGRDTLVAMCADLALLAPSGADGCPVAMEIGGERPVGRRR